MTTRIEPRDSPEHDGRQRLRSVPGQDRVGVFQGVLRGRQIVHPLPIGSRIVARSVRGLDPRGNPLWITITGRVAGFIEFGGSLTYSLEHGTGVSAADVFEARLPD